MGDKGDEVEHDKEKEERTSPEGSKGRRSHNDKPYSLFFVWTSGMFAPMQEQLHFASCGNVR